MPIPKRSTVYQEAGHAVAAALLGIQTEKVTVEPLDDAAGYHMLTDAEVNRLEAAQVVGSGEGSVPSLDAAHAVLRAHLTMVLAGELAQRRAAPRSYRHHHVEPGDHRRAVELIDRLSSGPEDLLTLGPAVGDEAGRLLDDHWRAVEAVAEALQEQHTLTGSEVRRIVANAA